MDTIQRIPSTQIVHEEEDGQTIEYQARQLFMQVVNHGIEHRTNITTFLNSLGLPVPEVDGWGYMWAHSDRFEGLGLFVRPCPNPAQSVTFSHANFPKKFPLGAAARLLLQ